MKREEVLALLPRLAGVVPALLADGRPSGFLAALARPYPLREAQRAAKGLRGETSRIS